MIFKLPPLLLVPKLSLLKLKGFYMIITYTRILIKKIFKNTNDEEYFKKFAKVYIDKKRSYNRVGWPEMYFVKKIS